jgi:hypothetical protein
LSAIIEEGLTACKLDESFSLVAASSSSALTTNNIFSLATLVKGIDVEDFFSLTRLGKLNKKPTLSDFIVLKNGILK